MISQMLQAFAALCVAVGLSGLLYGVTGDAQSRRTRGLRLLQGGMTAGGLLLIAASMTAGDIGDAMSGFLLLVLGTGVTAIQPSRRTETRPPH